MTSSDRHLDRTQTRWDYNIQRYKNNRDVFWESGLMSILVLACGRTEVTKRCLLSTIDAASKYPGEIEWIFVENGLSDDNFRFFSELPLSRKVIIRQQNYGINQGINQAWALSRGEWCMVHENDWECRKSVDFLSIARDIFNERLDVGIVQLRAVYDPCENWGIGKPLYSPWSCSNDMLDKAGVRRWQDETYAGHKYQIAKFPNGFNNNPTIIRKALYRECGSYPEPELGTDPRHGETEYQERVARTACAVAHIGLELYYHCGQVTTKAN